MQVVGYWETGWEPRLRARGGSVWDLESLATGVKNGEAGGVGGWRFGFGGNRGSMVIDEKKVRRKLRMTTKTSSTGLAGAWKASLSVKVVGDWEDRLGE